LVFTGLSGVLLGEKDRRKFARMFDGESVASVCSL